MLYVPKSNYPCYVVQDANTIRAYQSQPRQNSTSNYIDYYVNSHYMEKSGSQTWGTTTNLPTCLSSSLITDKFMYRNDIADIFIVFIIIIILFIYFPFKIFSRFFGRWFKL